MRARTKWLMIAPLPLLHFTLHPVLSGWPGAPDLLVAGLLVGSLTLRWDQAALLGCTVGLLEASMSLEPAGPMMLLFAIAGLVGGLLRQLIYSDSDRVLVGFVFLGSWLILLVRLLFVGQGLHSAALFVEAPLSAALTTLASWLGRRFALAVAS